MALMEAAFKQASGFYPKYPVEMPDMVDTFQINISDEQKLQSEVIGNHGK
ncbi:MAG: hypothetical protein V8Q57_00400 [Blautia sp.]